MAYFGQPFSLFVLRRLTIFKNLVMSFYNQIMKSIGTLSFICTPLFEVRRLSRTGSDHRSHNDSVVSSIGGSNLAPP
jgi:hypothetical protein